MRKTIAGFLLGLAALATSHAGTLSLANGSAGTIYWDGKNGNDGQRVDIYLQLDQPEGFSQTVFQFAGRDLASDTSYYIGLDSVDLPIIDQWHLNLLEAGTVIGLNNEFTSPEGEFLPTVSFLGIGGAYGSVGDNNYIGFTLQDTLGGTHYGWLQFRFVAEQPDGEGVTFLAGYYNDVAGEAVTVGAMPIPEPSMMLLLGAALVPALAVRRVFAA